MYENTLKYLKNKLTPKRLAHCVSTADTAAKLAKKHGADEQKAYIAGLLHDVAKGKCKSGHNKLTVLYGIEADEIELKNPELLHGRLGAAMVKDELNINDEDILNAIRWHTTGRSGMSLLEKIIYIADLIEPMRDFEGIDYIRELADKDINAAMAAAIRKVMDFVHCKGFVLHPNSIKAYNEFLKEEIN